MLANKNILVIGGDHRYIEIINTFSAANANVFIVGFDELNFASANVYNIRFNEISGEKLDAILLPVSGTNETGNVNLTFSKEEFVTMNEELIRNTPEHCVIYTGTVNSFLTNMAKASKKQLITLFDRDDLAIMNSIPTAEGTLQVAMEETDRTIHGSNVIVLGFGRVGISVAKLFSAVGAKVHVCARDSVSLARSIQMGLTPIKMEQLKQSIQSMNICINTIPHLMINQAILSTMDLETLIIDLASAPGGTDFETAKKKGMKALHTLGLPGKVAPKTAGEVLAQTLLQLIVEQK